MRVFRYAFRPDGLDVPPEAEGQFAMAADLWNTLVALEREHSARVDEVYRADTELGRQIDEEERLAARIAGLRLAVRRARRRRDEATRLPAASELEEALSARTALWDRQRALRRERMAILRPLLRAVDAGTAAAVKRARREATAAGLQWGTCNDVIARFLRARHRARRQHDTLTFQRKEGQTAGSLVVQLQHDAALRERPATMQRLFSGRHAWAGFFQMQPVALPDGWDRLPRSARREAERTQVRVRVLERRNRGRRELVYLEGVIVMHRPLPPEAIVKSVRVRREVLPRAGAVGPPRFAYSLHLACELAARSPLGAGARVAVDFRPRALPDGTIRTAVWRSSDGTYGETRLPADLVRRFAQADALGADIDRLAVRLRRTLARWLDLCPEVPEEVGAAARAVLEARSLRAFTTQAMRLHALGDAVPELATPLEAWRRRHRRLVLWATNLRAKTIRRRNDLYRQAALGLATGHDHIVVSDAVGPRRRRSGDPALRELRQTAAASTLRTFVREAAAKHGASHMEVVLAAPLHARCGASLERSFGSGRPAMTICPACHEPFDRDLNRCDRMLAIASADLAPAP